VSLPVEESCPEVFESDELPPRGSEPPWAPGNAGKSSDVIVNSAGSELFLFTMPTVIRKFDIPNFTEKRSAKRREHGEKRGKKVADKEENCGPRKNGRITEKR
jgi:hypothetical protein